jgi:hypothetical protein
LSKHLSYTQAGATYPRPVGPDTIRRYVRVGIGGIRLRSVKRGTQSAILESDLEDFNARVQAARPSEIHEQS